MAKQRGLGKGLSSLIPTAGPGIEENDPTSIPCEELSPNPFQPRREIPAESLEGLIASVKEHGVLQPILVRPTEDGIRDTEVTGVQTCALPIFQFKTDNDDLFGFTLEEIESCAVDRKSVV